MRRNSDRWGVDDLYFPAILFANLLNVPDTSDSKSTFLTDVLGFTQFLDSFLVLAA